jgi:hypothetical protein
MTKLGRSLWKSNKLWLLPSNDLALNTQERDKVKYGSRKCFIKHVIKEGRKYKTRKKM